MKSKVSKYVKISISILIYIILFVLFLNYFLFGNFNLKFNSVSYLFSKKKNNFNISRKYIEKSEKVSKSKVNGVGTVTYSYKANIDLKNKDIYYFTLKFCDEIDNYNIKLINNKSNKVKIDNSKSINVKNSDFYIVNSKNTKKIIITYTYDFYGNSTSKYKAPTIEKLKFNNYKDYKIIRDKVILDLFIFTIIYIGIFVMLYLCRNYLPKYNIKHEKLFVLLSLIFGITFSILIPIFQVPDEETHIKMIYKELGYENIDIEKYIGSAKNNASIIRNKNKKVDTKKYFSISNKLMVKFKFTIPKVSVLRHFPQAMALEISTIFHLPVFIAFFLAELFGVIFYTIVGYYTLKILPIKKDAMMFLMLLPIAVQQYSSFSYDCVTNAICFFMIAYILYLKFIKDSFELKDLVYFLLLLILICICKIPYVLLGLIIFIVPFKKWNIKLKKLNINYKFLNEHKYIIIPSFIILIITLACIVFEYFNNSYVIRTVYVSLMHPFSAIRLINRTIVTFFFEYVNSFFSELGWLETDYPFLIELLMIIFFLIFIFFDVDDDKYKLTVYDKIYIFIISLLMVCFTILSMLPWTVNAYGVDIDNISNGTILYYIRNIKYIGGVQGRYFIPFIFLIFLIFDFKCKGVFKKYKFQYFITIYYVVIYISSIMLLLSRYWI